MDDKVFKADAKQIVDMAFDNKMFKDDITRDDLNSFEDLLQFLLQSRFESYKMVDSLISRIDSRRVNS